MESVLILVSGFINFLHDFILGVMEQSGTAISDKELHFLIFGLIGMIIFFCSHAAFKFLQRWGIGLISFIFTGIVLTVLAVGIEIEQYITRQGSMETLDVLAGVAGFLVFFLAYCVILIIWRLILTLVKTIGKRKRSRIWHK